MHFSWWLSAASQAAPSKHALYAQAVSLPCQRGFKTAPFPTGSAPQPFWVEIPELPMVPVLQGFFFPSLPTCSQVGQLRKISVPFLNGT